MERNEYMFEESANFVEWSKWDRLLREHSSRGNSPPPPQLVPATPPSSPESGHDDGIVVPRHQYPDMRRLHPIRDPRRTHSRRRHGASLQDELLGKIVDGSERPHHQIYLTSEENHNTHQHKSHQKSYHYGKEADLPNLELESLRNVARQHESTPSPRKAMSEGGFRMDAFPRQWTDFEHDTDSFHLSNRPLSVTPSCKDNADFLGFPTMVKTKTAPPNDSHAPAILQPSFQPEVSQTQSEPLLPSSGMKIPARAYNQSFGGPPAISRTKKWSPKRLGCAGVSFSHDGDSRGAFPSLPENCGAFPSTASHRSVQTAPAAYIPLESKQHHQLETQKRREYLCSRQHLQFKQTMKELLEQEYSPYYVKSKTPSLLSHLTGTCSYDTTKSTRMASKPWKSLARRQRKEWFERSESKKGKMVSTKPRSMDLVFFETIPGSSTEQESFDIDTIHEEEEEEEQEYDERDI